MTRYLIALHAIGVAAMTRYLIGFYRLLLWAVRREIVIARSTGRNPLNVLKLRQDEDEYSRSLTRLEPGL